MFPKFPFLIPAAGAGADPVTFLLSHSSGSPKKHEVTFFTQQPTHSSLSSSTVFWYRLPQGNGVGGGILERVAAGSLDGEEVEEIEAVDPPSFLQTPWWTLSHSEIADCFYFPPKNENTLIRLLG